MRRIIAIVVLIIALSQFVHAQERPNVLIVMLDDFNDYSEAQGKHPQAYTPNIDAFLAENVHFQVATPAGVVCLPSRAAFLTGMTPVQTGIWDNGDGDGWKDLADAVTLPQAFENAGYVTASFGKTFHPVREARNHVNVTGGGGSNPGSPENLSGYPMGNDIMDWSQFPTDEEMGDHQRVNRFGRFLRDQPEDGNWLALLGLTATHPPFYCPDHLPTPLDDIILSQTRPNDLEDVPASGRVSEYRLEPYFEEYGLPAKQGLTHAYLNCSSYVDFEFGRVLEILADSGFADNTIVVLMSDQGYHMGEKQYYGKATLWNPNARGLLGIRIPGVEATAVATPVNTAATMSTLLELADVPDPYADNDKYKSGYRSFVPLISGTDDVEWDGVGVMFKSPQAIALRDERYTYIFSGIGLPDVQVYDMQLDPNEWFNIADSFDPVMIELWRDYARSILNASNGSL